MEEGQKIQEKALKMQIIEQQMAGMQKQLQQLEQQLTELAITKESLEDIKKCKEGSEMLSMLSPGIFIKTKLVQNQDVIINVGGNVAVKKKVEHAKQMVEEQIQEIREVQLQFMTDMEKFNDAITKMEKE